MDNIEETQKQIFIDFQLNNLCKLLGDGEIHHQDIINSEGYRANVLSSPMTKKTKTNPFDFVKAINEKKEVEEPSLYNPFIGNLAFSQTMDTVLLANEMNMYPNLPPEAQYAFLQGAITKRRRWGKWYKAEEHPHLQLVMDYYKYSKQKALEALQVLTQENIRDIQTQLDKGGNS